MLKWTNKPQSAALAFLVAGAFWFVVGTIYGMISAIHLVSPELIDVSFLVFGRDRPIHVNTVLYGFATTMLIPNANVKKGLTMVMFHKKKEAQPSLSDHSRVFKSAGT